MAIIKPDGLLGNYTDAIKAAIRQSGFKISQEKTVQLDEESATSFYAEHSTKKFFHGLVKYMIRYISSPDHMWVYSFSYHSPIIILCESIYNLLVRIFIVRTEKIHFVINLFLQVQKLFWFSLVAHIGYSLRSSCCY